MRKYDVIKHVAEGAGVTRDVAISVIECYQSVMKNILFNEGSIVLDGIGTLKIKIRKQRTRRDIRRNQAVVVPEHATIVFKKSIKTKERLDRFYKSHTTED